MLTLILLSASMSIDALGIGISYGVRKIKISLFSIFIMSIASLLICGVFSFLGSLLPLFFNEKNSSIIGCIMLLAIGIFIIYQGLTDKNTIKAENNITEPKKIFSCFIKALGITINIIKNPIEGDLNKSNVIEPKEALFLAVALSIDSVGAGISGSALGINPILFPFMICLFQLMFLVLGSFLGKKIKLKPQKRYLFSLFSGLALIIIALFNLI